jgi:hypothetical protein
MSDEHKWQALRQELSAHDPTLPPVLGNEVLPVDRRFAAYRGEIRTHIPEDEQDEVLPTDAFMWVEEDEHGDDKYYLWRRGDDERADTQTPEASER